MRKPLIAIAAILIAGVALCRREPEYQGRTMSEWVQIYEMSEQVSEPSEEFNAAASLAAVEAICQMRDTVLPRALRLIRYEKPEWKTVVERFMESRLDVRRWCASFIWGPFYGDPGEHAVVYFWMLGSKGAPAIPELTRILNEASSPRIIDRAMRCLSSTGSDGLAPLIHVLADQESPYRRMAAFAIGDMRLQAEPAVPLLMKCLDDPDVDVSAAAATVLRDLLAEAHITLSERAKCLLARDWDELARFPSVEEVDR